MLRCLNGADSTTASFQVDPAAVGRRLTSSTKFCIHGWSSGAGYAALNHRRPSLAVAGPRAWNNLPVDLRLSRTFSTFKTRLKSHLFNISFPSFWLYHWLFFVQSPWSRLCCICLSKFVISTLHYNTAALEARTLSRFHSTPMTFNKFLQIFLLSDWVRPLSFIVPWDGTITFTAYA